MGNTADAFSIPCPHYLGRPERVWAEADVWMKAWAGADVWMGDWAGADVWMKPGGLKQHGQVQ